MPKGNRPIVIRASVRRALRGVTLFEMVVVMAIVGILAAIGIPSYHYVMNSNRIAAEINGLLGDMQFARSEAIKEGQTVTVCVSTDGATCSTGNTTWNNGWIVFSDVNGNGSVDNPPDQVLRYQAAFTGTDTFSSNNSLSLVTFNREGFAQGIASGTLVTLHATPSDTSSTRCLALSMVGLMAVDTYGVGGCT